MLKFPRKEEGKKVKEMEGSGKEGKERKGEGERKKERKEMQKNGVVYLDRRRHCVKRNEGA